METDPAVRFLHDWEIVGKLEVGGRLSLSDASYFYDDPLVITLGADEYTISIRRLSSGDHEHVARIRIASSGESFSLGGEIGNVAVDFAQIGICDRNAIEVAFEALGDAGMLTFFEKLNVTDLVHTVQLPGSAKMFVVRPGFGDGTYPVLELLSVDRRRVGVEIECIGR